MTEKLFGHGRRGGVLLIAGAVLGAAVAGPGATIAQKAMNLNPKQADKRYVKRNESRQVGKVEETPLTVASATFTPIVQTNLKTPGPGFASINGSLSAKGQGATGGKLQYRLVVGNTPLSTTPQAFELFEPATNERQNGAVDGFVKIPRKGNYPISLQALSVGGNAVDVLGRSLTAVFTPKVKVGKGKKKKQGGGGGGAGQ